MSKKPHRVLWQVLPNGSNPILRWTLLRDSKFERLFMFQAAAIKAGVKSQEYEWDCYKFPSELLIHGRDGKIREKNTYPQESDPRGTKG